MDDAEAKSQTRRGEALEGLSRRRLMETVVRLEQENTDLRAHNKQLQQRLERLEGELARTREELAKARKDSSNSSKPPSSDIVKPPKPPETSQEGKRKIGAQPGHPRHERRAFTPVEVDEVIEHALDRCPRCGGQLSKAPEAPRVIQQAELVEKPIRVVEHRALAHWCHRCGKVRHAAFPPAVKSSGLLGARLTAMLAYLKGGCHVSYSKLRSFLDAIGIDVSAGLLAKKIRQTGAALAAPYAELFAAMGSQDRLNIDETGHKDNGKRMWTWCFSAPEWTVFRIADSRGAKVLGETLGDDFVGVIGCDYFSAYRKHARETGAAVQFCWAHLVRDIKFLTTLPDRVTHSYGERVLKAVSKMFRVIHLREIMKPKSFQCTLERQADCVLKTIQRAPPRTEARNLAKRFKDHAAEYFRFVSTPDLEPTNNAAERALRFVVIQRRITQGTRGETGRTWSERIWTAASSCAKQGRSLYDYLHQALLAHINGQPAPSLLPENP